MADEQNTPQPAQLEAQAWRIATAFERVVESIPLPNRTYQINRVHQTIAEMRGQDATRIHRLLEDNPEKAGPEKPARAKRQKGGN
jgi:hypothetical protein